MPQRKAFFSGRDHDGSATSPKPPALGHGRIGLIEYVENSAESIRGATLWDTSTARLHALCTHTLRNVRGVRKRRFSVSSSNAFHHREAARYWGERRSRSSRSRRFRPHTDGEYDSEDDSSGGSSVETDKGGGFVSDSAMHVHVDSDGRHVRTIGLEVFVEDDEAKLLERAECGSEDDDEERPPLYSYITTVHHDPTPGSQVSLTSAKRTIGVTPKSFWTPCMQVRLNPGSKVRALLSTRPLHDSEPGTDTDDDVRLDERAKDGSRERHLMSSSDREPFNRNELRQQAASASARDAVSRSRGDANAPCRSRSPSRVRGRRTARHRPWQSPPALSLSMHPGASDSRRKVKVGGSKKSVVQENEAPDARKPVRLLRTRSRTPASRKRPPEGVLRRSLLLSSKSHRQDVLRAASEFQSPAADQNSLTATAADQDAQTASPIQAGGATLGPTRFSAGGGGGVTPGPRGSSAAATAGQGQGQGFRYPMTAASDPPRTAPSGLEGTTPRLPRPHTQGSYGGVEGFVGVGLGSGETSRVSTARSSQVGAPRSAGGEAFPASARVRCTSGDSGQQREGRGLPLSDQHREARGAAPTPLRRREPQKVLVHACGVWPPKPATPPMNHHSTSKHPTWNLDPALNDRWLKPRQVSTARGVKGEAALERGVGSSLRLPQKHSSGPGPDAPRSGTIDSPSAKHVALSRSTHTCASPRLPNEGPSTAPAGPAAPLSRSPSARVPPQVATHPSPRLPPSTAPAGLPSLSLALSTRMSLPVSSFKSPRPPHEGSSKSAAAQAFAPHRVCVAANVPMTDQDDASRYSNAADSDGSSLDSSSSSGEDCARLLRRSNGTLLKPKKLKHSWGRTHYGPNFGLEDADDDSVQLLRKKEDEYKANSRSEMTIRRLIGDIHRKQTEEASRKSISESINMRLGASTPPLSVQPSPRERHPNHPSLKKLVHDHHLKHKHNTLYMYQQLHLLSQIDADVLVSSK
eukprot:Rmarinus@m.16798